jgi:hypothetical protein
VGPRVAALLFALAGCGGAIQVRVRPREPAAHHITVRAHLHPDEGRIVARVTMRLAQEPGDQLGFAIDPRLTARCASGERCELVHGPVTDRVRVYVVRGRLAELVIEGALGGDDAHPYVGADRVELTSTDLWYPRLDRAERYALTLEVDAEGDLDLVSAPDLDRDLGPFDPWAIVGAPEMETDDVGCEGAPVRVAYDRAFPGRAVAHDIASWTCDAMTAIAERIGAPEGAGPFRVLVAPRSSGHSYYLEPRGLVVTAYAGGYQPLADALTGGPLARPDALLADPGDALTLRRDVPVQSFPPEERERFRRFVTTHEVAHGFFTDQQAREARGLNEGLAQYLATTSLRDDGADVSFFVEGAEERLAAVAGSPRAELRARRYELEPYDAGVLALLAVERERGRAVVDEFLRRLRALGSWHRDAVREVARATIGTAALRGWAELD